MKTENVPARHAFEPAPEPEAFRFASGERARSLDEFASLIPALPDHVIDYHRPHFAPWVKEVVGDPPLAERVAHYGESGMATPEYRRVMADLVRQRLQELAAPPAAKKGKRPAATGAKRAKVKKG